jgi:hypothetical protein
MPMLGLQDRAILAENKDGKAEPCCTSGGGAEARDKLAKRGQRSEKKKRSPGVGPNTRTAPTTARLPNRTP